jgi:hypothetical protein
VKPDAPTAVPTIDPAIQQAQATAQAAIQKSLDAQATANAAVAFANQQEAAAKQAEADKAQSEAVKAQAEAQISANDVQLAEINRVADLKENDQKIELMLAENEQLRLENERRRLEIEHQRTVGVYAMLASLVVGLVYIVYRVVVRPVPNPAPKPVAKPASQLRPERAQAAPSLADDLAAEPIKVQYSSPDGMTVDLDEWFGIATREQLLAVAQGYLVSNATLAYKNWTGEGKPFSRAEFEIFTDAMIEKGLAFDVRGHAVPNEKFRATMWAVLEQYDKPE